MIIGGPWHVEIDPRIIFGSIVDAEHNIIAKDIRRVPDANLLASAPDLLEACEALVEFQRVYEASTRSHFPGNDFWASKGVDVVSKALAAINRAKGEK